jgi:AraC-like DNA-binding protein
VESTGQFKHFGPRKYHGLVFKNKGQARYNVAGQEFASVDNTILYLPRGREYLVDTGSDGACIAVNFDIADDTGLYDAALYHPDNPKNYAELFHELEKEWQTRRVGYLAKCLSLLYQILALLQLAGSMQNVPQYKYRRLRKAIQFLEEHYTDQDMNIGMLARQCGMSDAYFRRCFKEAYRLSPNLYIRTLRINRAKDLLNTGLLTTSQIAEQVGFSDLFYFSKAFKKAVGSSPTSYKNQTAD